ncbi:MAG: hypothetical protein ACRYG8_41295 [Janthinobacterium lividum]
MSGSVSNPPLGSGPNDFPMQPTGSGTGQQVGDPLDAASFGQHMQDAAGDQEERPVAGNGEVRQFAANNAFSTEARARRADATAGPGVDGHNVNITNAQGDGLKFNTLSGPNNIINNQGRVRINEIAEGATVNLPDNGGDVRVKFNNGHLQTRNNTSFIGVGQNNGALDVEENKGSVKVRENGTEGDVALGRKSVAGISQGGFPGFRNSGRVDISANHGTFEQHYGNGSLGQVLNLGRTSEVHRSTEVHAQPSGPGGKLRTPVAKGGGLILAGAGVATTLGVGAANWEGTYSNSKALANPTMPHPTNTTPTVTLPASASATHAPVPATSATPYLDQVSRTVGLDTEAPRSVGLSSEHGAVAETDAPHASAPKIRI